MANEKVNKVILGNETLIDLTGDTVSANNLLSGATAHDSRGEQIQGEVSVPTDLDDLSDVSLSSPALGDSLFHDGTEWVNKNLMVEVTKAEYDALVANNEDDPNVDYHITDVDVAEAYYVETSGQTALTGATSLTFTNSHITPTSDIRILAEPASCKVASNPQYKVKAKISSVGNGTATITFPALSENTEFWLLIECPLAITQNDETKADKIDLASINVIGSTNTTGSVIYGGTYFYLNGLLVRAKADIATNATFTLNTNYEVVSAGALNELNPKTITATKGAITTNYTACRSGNVVTVTATFTLTSLNTFQDILTGLPRPFFDNSIYQVGTVNQAGTTQPNAWVSINTSGAMRGFQASGAMYGTIATITYVCK